ncbi:DUF3618 domain-containing protein [Archangium sp.]|jgi:ElaB/YqjD/DUF883 family membrane-anchored ribosome-binding protein|uniref:DUF3618 domain-containing protein n=1 Tax=Archangium sp. TaxID=1872627 RepID=UPI002EDB8548
MAADGKVKTSPQSPEQIRAEIERTRNELVHSVTVLREEVAWRTDWRQWVRRNPMTCVGAAFFVGFLIGSSRRR